MTEPLGRCDQCKEFGDRQGLQFLCTRKQPTHDYCWNDGWCPSFKRRLSPAEEAAQEIVDYVEYQQKNAGVALLGIIRGFIEKHCGKGGS